MHFIAALFVFLTYPALVTGLRSFPQYRHWAYFFLGMLPFVVHIWQLDSALINWAAWPGYAKGIVTTVEDTIALAIITTQRQPRGTPPYMGYLFAYMGAVTLSIVFADIPMATTFYVWQLLRFAVIMAAVAKMTVDPNALKWLGMGMSGGMIYEAFVTADQKFHGAFQTPGTMAHPNQLGMMAHFIILPLLGMLFAGYRSRTILLGVLATLLVIVLGASRATIGFVGAGVAIMVLLSMRRKSTPQKKRMITVTIVAMLVATPFLVHSINNRMRQQYQTETDYDERAAFERAANMMWHDHPMGVGANNYINVAVSKGYSERAGVSWINGSRGTNVHNTYLLVGAETGYIGLITYVLFFGSVFLGGWRFAFAEKKDPRGDIALGCTMALAAMALHSRYEWITVTYHVQYVIAISVGIISGLVRVRALERRQIQREKWAAEAAAEEEVQTGQEREPALA